MCLDFIINGSVWSGYFHFGNNHFLVKLPFFKYILQMLADGRNTNPEHLRHSLLGAPYRFVFYDDLHFAAVFRHIVQEELNFFIHIDLCQKP